MSQCRNAIQGYGARATYIAVLLLQVVAVQEYLSAAPHPHNTHAHARARARAHSACVGILLVESD